MPSVCAWRELSHQKRVKLSTESCLLLWGHLTERHPQPPSENALATYDSETGVALEGGDGASLTGQAAEPLEQTGRNGLFSFVTLKENQQNNFIGCHFLAVAVLVLLVGFSPLFPHQ